MLWGYQQTKYVPKDFTETQSNMGFQVVWVVRIHLQCRRCGFDTWVGKIPWRRKWKPTPGLVPGKFHGQRSLVGYIYSTWGRKELDTTWRLNNSKSNCAISIGLLMLLNCVLEKTQSLGLQGDPTSPSWRRSVLSVHWKDWCWSWNSNTLATWCEELIHWKRPWCWERLRAGGEGDDRGWDGWMASPTRWTWVWVNSGNWWWTGRPGVLWFMGSQRVRHNWVTELNWTDPCHLFSLFLSACQLSGQLVSYPVNKLSWDSLTVFLGSTFCSSYAQNAMWYSNNISLMVLILWGLLQ